MEKLVKTIGLCALSAPGAAICYQRIISQSYKKLAESNFPNIVMYHPNTAALMSEVQAGRWDAVADIILSVISKLEQVGADLVAIPVNTVHFAIDRVVQLAQVPVINMLKIVAGYAKQQHYKKVLILGTRQTTSGLYHAILAEHGIAEVLPSQEDCEAIHNIIFDYLIPMDKLEHAEKELLALIEKYRSSCDAIALACTELPMVLNNINCKHPVIDTTRLLADDIVDSLV